MKSPTSDAIGTQRPFRGFAAASIVASLLGGTCLVLLSDSSLLRAASAALAAGAAFFGWRVLLARQVKSSFSLTVLFAVLLMVLFVHNMVTAVQYPFRLLQAATLLTFAAVVIAAALRCLRLTCEGTALAVTFSIAFALFLGEIALPRLAGLALLTRKLQTASVPKWTGPIEMHPLLGYRYKPNSNSLAIYPDNPRGYFEQTDPVAESWLLETHEGGKARMELFSKQPVSSRVTIEHAGQRRWQVQLQQAPFRLERKIPYSLSFRARSEVQRTIACAVSQNHAPWQDLGLYREFEVGRDWQRLEFPFVARADDESARIHFDLGGSAGNVEISDVILRRTGSEIVRPDLTPEYVVRYRFNSLGCRGHDYSIPRPANTFRILALGDSYCLGTGVHEQDTVTARLEESLNRISTAGISYEVINCAVSGYATREERIAYELFYSKYTPQLVLLMLVFNDDRSWLEEKDDGSILPPDRFERLSTTWTLLKVARTGKRNPDYSRTVRELLSLNEACQRNGSRLVVVFFRNSFHYMWNQLYRAVVDGTKGVDVPLFDLGPALLETHSVEDLSVHPYDGHPNDVAHRIAADELRHFLETNGFLSR